MPPARRDSRSDVAQLVRLHHRRRGWAWVAAGSAIGLVVFAGIDVSLFENLTGTAETLSVIPVFLLLALVLAGLVVVIVDTSRLHRADAAVRMSAKGGVSHYPLYAHAHRYPPRHHGSWVFVIFMLAAMTGIAVAILPAEVNAWGYVVGAENQDTFNPVSYGQACGGGVGHGYSCHTVTEGYLPAAVRMSPGAVRCRSASRSGSTTRSGPGAAGGLSPAARARRSRPSSRACSSME